MLTAFLWNSLYEVSICWLSTCETDSIIQTSKHLLEALSFDKWHLTIRTPPPNFPNWRSAAILLINWVGRWRDNRDPWWYLIPRGSLLYCEILYRIGLEGIRRFLARCAGIGWGPSEWGPFEILALILYPRSGNRTQPDIPLEEIVRSYTSSKVMSSIRFE
jgi:hypothetical protein